MTTAKTSRIDFSITDLNPCVRAAYDELIARAATIKNQAGFYFQPFEGFRHPERQHYLVTVKKTSKAWPWQSAHQYGLAVDFAGFRVGPNGSEWSWQLPSYLWEMLHDEAAKCGLLAPIKWDLGHIQSPLFYNVKKAWATS